MADSLPSPPTSRPVSEELDSPSPSTLTARIDELLEKYLELLDQYTALREELTNTFSSGFFALAQAQRSSTLGPGRRYGQDCYDERMKAQRRVVMSVEEDASTTFAVNRIQSQTTSEASKGRGQAVEAKDSLAEKKRDPATRDPLTWFGILAPPALRQTQHSFVKAVQGSLPALLSIDSQMQSTEEEIWTLREELGIVHQYKPPGAEVEAITGNVEPPQNNVLEPPERKPTPKSSRRKELVSRPAHVRSQLLKLGD